MKKRIIAFCVLAVFLISFTGCYQTIENKNPDNTKDWNITDGSLNSYTGKEQIVEIPSDVTTINSGAFTADDDITAVVIPPQVSAIAEDSFKDKENLTIYAESNFQMLENVAKKNNFQLKAIAKEQSSSLINISVKNGTVLYNDEAGLAVVTLPGMQQSCDISVYDQKGGSLTLYSDMSLSLRCQTPIPITQYETNLYTMTSDKKIIQITILSKRDTVKYSDQNEISDWAKDSVEMINQRGYGLFNGDSQLNFNASDPITRYELAKIICNTLGLESVGFASSTQIKFSDEIDAQYQQYVKAVTSTGVMGALTKNSETVFAGDDLVTREQFAGIIVRAILYYNNVNFTSDQVYLALKDQIEQAYHKLNLADMQQVSQSELKNIKLAMAYYNVLSPINYQQKSYIAPNQNITREQAAMSLANILKNRMEGSKILYSPEYSIVNDNTSYKFELNNNVAIVEFNEIYDDNADESVKQDNQYISYNAFTNAIDTLLNNDMSATTLSDYYNGKCESDKKYFIIMLTGTNDQTYKLAKKALTERDLKADIFIYTDFLESSESEALLQTLWYLTENGSNVYSHYSKSIDLTGENSKTIKSELDEGFYKLEALFGTTEKFFAYPLSSYNMQTYNVIANADVDLQLVQQKELEGENLLFYYHIDQMTDINEVLPNIYFN